MNELKLPIRPVCSTSSTKTIKCSASTTNASEAASDQPLSTATFTFSVHPVASSPTTQPDATESSSSSSQSNNSSSSSPLPSSTSSLSLSSLDQQGFENLIAADSATFANQIYQAVSPPLPLPLPPNNSVFMNSRPPQLQPLLSQVNGQLFINHQFTHHHTAAFQQQQPSGHYQIEQPNCCYNPNEPYEQQFYSSSNTDLYSAYPAVVTTTTTVPGYYPSYQSEMTGGGGTSGGSCYNYSSSSSSSSSSSFSSSNGSNPSLSSLLVAADPVNFSASSSPPVSSSYVYHPSLLSLSGSNSKHDVSVGTTDPMLHNNSDSDNSKDFRCKFRCKIFFCNFFFFYEGLGVEF
jgi:hypothetical protein